MGASVINENSVELRPSHYGRFQSLYPQMVERLYWTRQQIEDYRTESFRDLLRHVRASSPWHAERVAHIDPDRATMDDLKSIPPMTKIDLMENWDRIVTIPGATLGDAEAALRVMKDQTYLWGDHALLASGGTGGRPGVFVYDWDAMATNLAGMSRSMIPAWLNGRSVNPFVRAVLKPAVERNWGGVSRRFAVEALTIASKFRPARVAAIGAETSAHGSYVMTRIFCSPVKPTIMLSSWRSIDEIAPRLNACDPELLSVYPTMMPALAEAIRDGKLKIAPKVVQFVSEHCSKHNFQLARELWPDAALMAFWATSEGGVTFPCPLGDSTFHVSDDLAVIEPIYADGQPTQPDQPSDGIYLTNLFNRALPIIRYHIDDMFEFDPKPCSCGHAFTKVRDVRGRGWEKFRYGSIAVHPLAIELAVLKQPSITTYQIRQTREGVSISYAAQKDVEVDRLRNEIGDALRSYGLTDPVVEIEQLPEIERTAAGKMRRFIPLSS